MRTVPPAMAMRLAGGSTQFAHAWILRRQDGAVLGFTDHDSDLMVEGVSCIAASGLGTKDMTSELGLAPSGGEIMGALQAASLREEDIVAGVYDGAEIRFILCDCEAPFETLLLDVATIGEIKRDETAFVAELRGPAHHLGEETGRLYQQRCDADFGDRRCGVDLNRSDLSAAGQIEAVIVPGRYRVFGLGGHAAGVFSNGTLIFASRPGRQFQVRLHAVFSGTTIVDLWLAPEDIVAGEAFSIVMGCDKAFETCAQRYNNALNFRGFPHMPGNETVLTIVQDGEPGYDGGSLFHG